MEVPPMEMNLDIEELKAMFWEDRQMMAIYRKHIAKLEGLMRGVKEPLDLAAQKDLERVPSKDGAKVP